jgi:hypothetical protein
MDDTSKALLDSMENAAKSDLELNREKQPALAKLKQLHAVMQLLKKCWC